MLMPAFRLVPPSVPDGDRYFFRWSESTSGVEKIKSYPFRRVAAKANVRCVPFYGGINKTVAVLLLRQIV